MDLCFISLGCDKNRVDSEVMVALANEAGFNIISDEQKADVIIINTCCFIKDALEESIETIIEMAKYKDSGNCKGIIVSGCLGQRYEKEIFEEIPEIDVVLGTTSYDEIVKAVKAIESGERHLKIMKSIDEPEKDEKSEKRSIISTGYYAYLKIAEGCDNHCTYCVIPKLRGKYRSRKMDSLLRETQNLANNGVKELIIVAQDITLYGKDLYGEVKLPQLLTELCKIEGIEWIRLLYCYPEHITDEIIQVIAREKKICKYIDMPLQHASDSVLKRMGRKSTKNMLREKINALRKAMPNICIRTTLITGFPQETQEEFEELVEFIKEIKFDRLGVFTYSQEEGTPASNMPNQIDEKVKQERKNIIMEEQEHISNQKCNNIVGKVLKVIVEGKLPYDNVYCARSYRDAPDIDGYVFFNCDYEILSGDFVDVKITEASYHDLIGEIYYADEFTE